MMSLLIQLLGIIAWILITISYWQKKKINLLIIQLIAYLLYALHFYLLDGLSGALCNLAGIIILFLLYIKEKKNKPMYILIPIIIAIFIPIIIYSYDGLYSLLPVVASIIPLTANWVKKMSIIKIGGIIGSICWLIYAIFTKSYASMITEVIFITSTLISLNKTKEEIK